MLNPTATPLANPTPIPSQSASRGISPLRAAAIMIGRCLRLSRRNIEVLMTSVTLPVMLMLLFVYLFGGAINSDGTSYVNYVVPGVLLLSVGWSTANTTVSVAQDMKGGIIDRFRSLDIGGAAFLAGHVAASVARNSISIALVLIVALLIGFRPSGSPLHWLAAMGILLLFVVALTWFCALLGLLASSPEGASGFSFFVSFLPYPSSAMVPIHTMPTWLQGFAQNQPLTPVIDSLRALLLDVPVGDNAWHAVIWSVGILLVAILLSGVVFQRRTA